MPPGLSSRKGPALDSGADQTIQATDGIGRDIRTAVDGTTRKSEEELIENLDHIAQIYLPSVIHIAGVLTLERTGVAKHDLEHLNRVAQIPVSIDIAITPDEVVLDWRGWSCAAGEIKNLDQIHARLDHVAESGIPDMEPQHHCP